MTQREARRLLRIHLRETEGLCKEEIDELIDEVQYQILDFIDGKRDYNSIEQILYEYLNVGLEYLDAFQNCLQNFHN